MPFKCIISAFLCFIFSVNLSGQERIQKTFEGTINGTIPVVLTLTQDGSAVFGNVVYKKKGIPITVVGNINEGMLFANELMADGIVTGTYSGEIKGETIAGSWFAPKNNSKELKLNLRQTGSGNAARKALPDLTGTYFYSFGKDNGSGELKIIQSDPSKITLSFDCINGPPAYNMAMINKTALKLNGNVAVYENNEFGKCKIKLVFEANTVQVDYVGDAYECGFGNAASVVGNYIKIKNNKPVFESR